MIGMGRYMGKHTGHRQRNTTRLTKKSNPFTPKQYRRIGIVVTHKAFARLADRRDARHQHWHARGHVAMSGYRVQWRLRRLRVGMLPSRGQH
jgi:hypothetical protein